MTLAALLATSEPLSPVPDLPVSGLDFDSRRITPGAVFFAFPGENVDGHDFIDGARKAGAVAVVSERPRPEGDPGPWVQVRHGRRALAAAALVFYDRPDQRLRLVGVTGTNGKTTTVYLIDSILRAAGLTTGRFGTIEHRIGEQAVAAVNTTPESLDLVRLLVRLEEAQGSHAVLEASSHALDLGRIHGFRFDVAVFTNLSQDHLDFHRDMESYFAAKRKLFEGLGDGPPRVGVINADDDYGRRLLELDGFRPLSFSMSAEADLRAVTVEADFEGLRLEVETPRGRLDVRSPLLGRFNAANILAAAGVGLAYDLDLTAIARGIESFAAAPGRFETIREGQAFAVVVDYAHTDDALRNVLAAARELAGEGRVLTVFGCGGDRDRSKRPLMGEAAGVSSDRVIVTTDNPRHEDPLRIIADAEVGLQRVDADYVREPDRRAAIGKALAEACPGDIVVIAGKGHESYQQVGDEKLPFDDRETARSLLKELAGGRRAK